MTTATTTNDNPTNAPRTRAERRRAFRSFVRAPFRPGAHVGDTDHIAVFSVICFWLAILGVVLLFVAPWYVGAGVIALAGVLFLGAAVLGD
ncbi:MAG: hypothetical protein AAGD00_05360 [Planctomycetota bacterium]